VNAGMTSYESLCASLGINRGSLETGFADAGSTSRLARDETERESMRVRDVRPKRKGHTNIITREWIAKRCSPELRPLHLSLFDRGSSVVKIAKAIGVHPSTVQRALSGYQGSARVKVMIAGQLTEQEKGMLR
jgi:hypothetical protein